MHQAINRSSTPHIVILGTRLLTCVLCLIAGASEARAAIPPAERQVLINLYTSTNGASWSTNTGWNGGAGTECSWFGVTCDDTSSHVTEIQLSGNNLTGTLPDLTGLSELMWFYVAGNQLTGSIPSLGGLTNFQNLIASDNQLTGSIPPLSGLANLDLFIVDHNQLSGTIPDLSGLTGMSVFDASTNQLSGPIPSLSGLTFLSGFYVNNNQLTGAIPDLSAVTNLYDFDAATNQLSGSIPSLSGLTHLAYFLVGGNQLTGAVPSAPANLVGGQSTLCSNLFDTSPQPAIDPAWDAATGHSPWWATPSASNNCDDVFTDGFE